MLAVRFSMIQLFDKYGDFLVTCGNAGVRQMQRMLWDRLVEFLLLRADEL